MQVVECAVCGLAYLNPRPKPEFIVKFYEKGYFTGESLKRGEGGLRCDIIPGDTGVLETGTPSPRSMTVINEKYGGVDYLDVLEIGCATGDLLIRLKDAGAHVKGLEISDFAAGIARGRGLDVFTGEIEGFAEGADQKFDIVLALEVIEHVTSPTRFFASLDKVIKPGGVLLISTPNYLRAKRYGQEWLGFNTSFEHLYFFTIDVLTRFGQRNGLSLRYSESSRSLGHSSSVPVACGRHYRKAQMIRALVRELGFFGTLRELGNLRKGFISSAIGHQLIAVFQKGLRSE
ncbi:MAG: class I SAM-dependent methyltransferase [Nitrospirae bacterium]|nr:class I SAM-dependent methyltransferase [Nitrospirota bacterium]